MGSFPKWTVHFFSVNLQLTVSPGSLLFHPLLWLVQYLEGYIMFPFPFPFVDQILVLVAWNLLLMKLMSSLSCR